MLGKRRTARVGLATMAALALSSLVLALLPAAAGADTPTVTVSGTVTTSKGAVLVGWTVQLYNTSATVVATGTTDASGHYAFSAPVGGWELALLAPGSTIGSTLVTPNEGFIGLFLDTETGPVTADLELPVVTQTLHVVDQGGNPVPDTRISVPAYSADDLSSPVLGTQDRVLFAYQQAQTVETDSTGTASLTTLGLRHSVWAVGATAQVQPPADSGLSATTLGVIPTRDEASTITLTHGLATYTVKGTARRSDKNSLFSWLVQFETSTGTVLSSSHVELDDYQATVPADATRVVLSDDDPTEPQSVQTDGLVLTGNKTLNLTQPVVNVTVQVRTTGGGEVKEIPLVSPGVGSAGSPVPIDPIFAGGTTGTGWQGGFTGSSGAKGNGLVQLLRTAATSVALEADPPASLFLQAGSVTVTPSAYQTVPLVLPSIPTVVPGSAGVTAPTSGTTELDVPVTLSAPSTQTVAVAWTTLSVAGAPAGQAPTSDYVAASGTVTFTPGQTTASVPITVTGNSLGVDEYLVVSFTSPANAFMGGFWGLGFGGIDPPP